MAALALVVLAYYLVALLWRRRTVRHLLLDLDVGSVSAEPGRLRRVDAVRRAFVRTVLDAGAYLDARIALLAGEFVVGVVLWLLAVGLLVVDALPALGGAGRSVTDRLSGIVVRRAGLYRQSLTVVRQATAAPTQQVRAVGTDLADRTVGTARRVVDSDRGREVRAASAELGTRVAAAYRNRNRRNR